MTRGMAGNRDILWMQRHAAWREQLRVGQMVEDGKCWWRLFLLLAGYKVLYLALISLAAVSDSCFDYGKADRIQRKWFLDSKHGKERGNVEKHYTTWDAEHIYISVSLATTRK